MQETKAFPYTFFSFTEYEPAHTDGNTSPNSRKSAENRNWEAEAEATRGTEETEAAVQGGRTLLNTVLSLETW